MSRLLNAAVLAALFLLLSVRAYAQSSPNWPLGYVPTPSEWNQWAGSKKVDVNGGTLNMTATGGTTQRSLADRFAQVINVKDYGAKGDGTTDDSAAITAAINQSNAYSAAGTPAAIYVPGGQYLVSANTLPAMTRGGAVYGDGTHKTYVIMSSSYTGDLFSWSESWMASDYGGSTLSPANDKAGPILRDLTIVGNNGASGQQNAIELYDKVDFANIGPVDVFFVHGQCLGLGATKNASVAYTRESNFANINCFNSGLTNVPAVSISSYTTSATDSTNQLRFYRLGVFSSAGVGLSITSPDTNNSVRTIQFDALRVEYSAKDNIQIGSATDAGVIQHLTFFGVDSVTPGQSSDGFYALNLDTAGSDMYGITIYGGNIGPCWSTAQCKGIHIGKLRSSLIQLPIISTAGTNVTYESTTGSYVTLNGGGSEQTWTYAYNGSTYRNYVVAPVLRSGDPGSTQSTTTSTPSITAFYHDSSASFGNTAGGGAVDLQILRNANVQAATGSAAALIGGSFNRATGNASGVVGGSGNIMSGAQGFAGGGLNANDRGRAATQAFSGGIFSTSGDAQAAHFVLSATCSSCSSQRLTSGHAAAGATTVANISNTQSYAMSWRCVARDVTTAGTDNATFMPVLLMTRDANAASTAVAAGTAATATRGTWTGGGFAFSADTTNGGLNIAFTSPTGNTDTFHTVCEGLDAEVQ